MLREEFRENNIKCPLSLDSAKYYLSLGYKIILRGYRFDSNLDYVICNCSNANSEQLRSIDILNRNDLRKLLSHQIFYTKRMWIEFSTDMLCDNNYNYAKRKIKKIRY